MSEKIKVAAADIMARDKTWVTYRDAGGTLRKARASQVLVEGEGDGSNPTEPETPEPEQVETAAEPQEVPPADSISDTPPEPAPPASDMPPEPPAAASPKSTKPKVKREKPMATAQTAAKAKIPAKKAPARVVAKSANKRAPNGETGGIRTIGGKAVNLENYERVKTPAGGTSFHNGDPVATKLQGKTLDEVYAFAAKTLKEDEKALRVKYKHLNVGMQRMSLGNRLRKVLIPKEAKN